MEKQLKVYSGRRICVFIRLGRLYFLSNINSVRKSIYWKDEVAVFSLSALSPKVVGNVGDGAVYFSHILVEFELPSEIDNKKKADSPKNRFYAFHDPIETKLVWCNK